MILIKGNKQKEIAKKEFNNMLTKFDQIILDLGTGDGRFVYDSAIKTPQNLYIGIDPSEKQLKIFSKKAQRKKLKNALFVPGSVEILPSELDNKTDIVCINFPWGTLLQTLVLPIENNLKKITKLLKPNGELKIILGFSSDLEPSESKRLNLPEINLEFIENSLLPAYEKIGLKSTDVKQLNPQDLKQTSTTWGKKIHTTKDRPFFRLTFTKA